MCASENPAENIIWLLLAGLDWPTDSPAKQRCEVHFVERLGHTTAKKTQTKLPDFC